MDPKNRHEELKKNIFKNVEEWSGINLLPDGIKTHPDLNADLDLDAMAV